MAKQISWGTGIVIAIILFFILNGIVLYIAFGQKVDLVTDNYYEKELIYQKEIDKQNNSNVLSVPVKIEYEGNLLSISFPSGLNLSGVSGKIHLYRPSDSSKDKYYKLEIDPAGRQVIALNNFEKGLWRVVADWTLEGKDYLEKTDIFIN